MNFVECIMTLVQRPGYLAVLPDKRIIRLNQAGYILDATRARDNYVRFNVGDVLAVTWECWTPEQLASLASQKVDE
jgi:hypothetical protein